MVLLHKITQPASNITFDSFTFPVIRIFNVWAHTNDNDDLCVLFVSVLYLLVQCEMCNGSAETEPAAHALHVGS